MNLKAIILPGQTEIIVNGLHQWDYGRALEIQSEALPALLEVHFACPSMKEAVVRSCSGAGGVATAAIPDVCLEQTAPITAWVYKVGETTGATIITITLPVIARTRPQVSATVPTTASDKYTEAVAAMNEAVAAVTSGKIKVDAGHADEADHAASADALVFSSLSAGTDLNDVTTPGMYKLGSGSYTNAKGGGTLRVLEVEKNGQVIWQTLKTNAYNGSSGWSPPRLYRRCYSTLHVSAADGGSATEYGWTEWLEDINAYNIAAQSITATSINPTRYGSVSISNANGTMQSALQNNTIYLVVIKGTNSGTDSGVFLHTTSSAIHGVTVGECYIEIADTDIRVENLDIAPKTATVTFYELGSV